MPLSTVSGILTTDRDRQARPAGRWSLPQRYERSDPGELDPHRCQEARTHPRRRWPARVTGQRQHNHARKRDAAAWIARPSAGSSCMSAIDDATRLAYVEVLADEKATTAIAFLRRAVAHYASLRHHRSSSSLPITDPPTAQPIHAIACRTLGIRHLRTRPYRPQTNGKAERFIRTMLGGWAYGAIYRSQRRAQCRASPAGSTSTIANDHTEHSATGPRSLDYTSSTGTTSSGPTSREGSCSKIERSNSCSARPGSSPNSSRSSTLVCR